MADVYIGIDRGAQKEDILTDSSTTGLDVEVVYDAAVSLKKAEIVAALQQIIGFLVSDEISDF